MLVYTSYTHHTAVYTPNTPLNTSKHLYIHPKYTLITWYRYPSKAPPTGGCIKSNTACATAVGKGDSWCNGNDWDAACTKICAKSSNKAVCGVSDAVGALPGPVNAGDKVCYLHISVYIQSIFSLYSVYIQSMFSLYSVYVQCERFRYTVY